MSDTSPRRRARNTVDPVVDSAIRESINQTLLSMGLNPDDPLMSQDTFVALGQMVKVFRDPDTAKDRDYVRAKRLEEENLTRAGKTARIGATWTLMGGVLLWLLKTGYDLIHEALSSLPHTPTH